jgi:hypothetical protein
LAPIYSICLKCNREGELTRYHVFPRRHYPLQHRPFVVLVCRKPCHDELEKLIPFEEVPLEEYLKIHREYFGEVFEEILASSNFVVPTTAYDP